MHGSLKEAALDSLSCTEASFQVQAAKIFKVPHVEIAIIDRHRIWIKAAHGAPAKGLELSRELSLTSYMLLNEKKEVMVVEDTAEDGR